MHSDRRAFIRTVGGTGIIAVLAAAGFLKPWDVRAESWNKTAFDTESLQDAIKVLVGGSPVESTEVTLVAPDIAENGAVVPVGVVASMAGVESIAILCEKNPHPLAAIYELPEGTLPDIQTRVKMAQTSNVVALVKAEGKFHFARKEIKVTMGGCGG